MIKSEVEVFFIKKYRSKPILVKAPGRVNLIGEHTDYNLGYVLPASIEKGIYFAAQKNNTGKINIEAFLTQPEQIVFALDGSHQPFRSFWGKYFKAILEILLEKDCPLIGFDCVFGGDIPIGAGLSSSAALCCGFIHALTELGDFEIAKKDIALIAQKAEHKIGLNCGLMDQYAVLFGKKGNALFLDCKDISREYVPINFEGYSWVLINSNITHNLAVDSEYNKRRNSCELVVGKVANFKNNVDSLRDISFEDLEKIKRLVSPTDYKRAGYVLAENERVIRMIDALEKGDAKQSGAILLEGHWAMSTEYEITTDEIDILVSAGQKLEGVMGSRMMGGGFGGCTINLMKTKLIETHSKAILATYKKETGIDAEVYHLKIDDGVRTLAH
ncbi:MAG: galactokinase [Maribacter sp.]|jgi:galactokinase